MTVIDSLQIDRRHFPAQEGGQSAAGAISFRRGDEADVVATDQVIHGAAKEFGHPVVRVGDAAAQVDEKYGGTGSIVDRTQERFALVEPCLGDLAIVNVYAGTDVSRQIAPVVKSRCGGIHHPVETPVDIVQAIFDIEPLVGRTGFPDPGNSPVPVFWMHEVGPLVGVGGIRIAPGKVDPLLAEPIPYPV